jgi:hypothetical protein
VGLALSALLAMSVDGGRIQRQMGLRSEMFVGVTDVAAAL